MLLDDKLLTTLDKPQRILDIGTGTGIWAVEIGGKLSFTFLVSLGVLAWG